MSEEALDELQARHLAYRAELKRQGVLVANGPLSEQTDIAMRGLSIYACDLVEAARLSDGDPSVQAGRLAYDLMEWWVASGTFAFPSVEGTVGERRAMPDDCPRSQPAGAVPGSPVVSAGSSSERSR